MSHRNIARRVHIYVAEVGSFYVVLSTLVRARLVLRVAENKKTKKQKKKGGERKLGEILALVININYEENRIC